jgi:hypothetical protein
MLKLSFFLRVYAMQQQKWKEELRKKERKDA